MAVSGQKSETSIRSYSHHVSEQKKREMSLALTTHMTGFISNVVNSEPKHCATISLPQSNKSSERQQLSDITNVPHEEKANHFNFYNCTVNINNWFILNVLIGKLTCWLSITITLIFVFVSYCSCCWFLHLFICFLLFLLCCFIKFSIFNCCQCDAYTRRDS